MFHINESSVVPIYQQIVDEFIKLIVRQIIPEDAQLPSVREMAMQLQINPNTIQKAYKVLETEGYVFSKPGIGSFVALREKIRQIHMKKLDEALIETLKAYAVIETDSEQLLKHIENILKELSYD